MKQLKTKPLTNYDVINRALVAGLQLEDVIDQKQLIAHILNLHQKDTKEILKRHFNACELTTIPNSFISKNHEWYIINDNYHKARYALDGHYQLLDIKEKQTREKSLLITGYLALISLTMFCLGCLKILGLLTNPLIFVTISLILLAGMIFHLPKFQIRADLELKAIRQLLDGTHYVHTSFILKGKHNLSPLLATALNNATPEPKKSQ